MATWMKVDGSSQAVAPSNGATFVLAELKMMVDGWIELVALEDGRLMVCNEEGFIRGLNANEPASRLFDGTVNSICGDVLVCRPDEID